MNLRRPLGGTPSIALDYGVGGDMARRVIIRESAVYPGGAEWSPQPTDSSEREGARGLILAREYGGGGQIHLSLSGLLHLDTGGGTLRMRLRVADASVYPSPIESMLNFAVMLTHDVAITGTGAAGAGGIRWDLDIFPYNTNDSFCSGLVYSKVQYQRTAADTLQVSEFQGARSIGFGARTDKMVMITTEKLAGSGANFIANAYLEIDNFDGWVDNGQSGVG